MTESNIFEPDGAEKVPPKIDLTGKRFGRLVVLSLHGRTGKTRAYTWECRCDCGSLHIATGGNLQGGRIKSCGCLRRASGAKRLIDITGKRIGRLVVIQRATSKRGRTMWLCKCDCGNTKAISGYRLRGNQTESCGCIGKEITSRRVRKDLTGKRFGRLMVVCEEGMDGQYVAWKCQCDCGNMHVCKSASLISGNVRSCGCLREDILRECRGAESQKIFDEDRAYSMTSDKRHSVFLSDSYIKGLLTARSGVSFKDIPQSLIEAKRLQIKIKRELDNEKH